MKNRVCAVIVAAGSSSRMGGTGSKVLMELCGEPVLGAHAAGLFPLPSGGKGRGSVQGRGSETMTSIGARFPIVKEVVNGGSTRQASVAAGWPLPEIVTLSAIHDGARPLVTPEEIDSVIADCEQWGLPRWRCRWWTPSKPPMSGNWWFPRRTEVCFGRYRPLRCFSKKSMKPLWSWRSRRERILPTTAS